MKTFKKISIGLLVLAAFSGLWAIDYEGTWNKESITGGEHGCSSHVDISGYDGNCFNSKGTHGTYKYCNIGGESFKKPDGAKMIFMSDSKMKQVAGDSSWTCTFTR